MDSKNISKENRSELKSKVYFEDLKSDYFLQKIFEHIKKNKVLGIIKYDKKIQNRLNISIKDYKEYSEIYSSIEIEIIPIQNSHGNFIKIKGDESYYHIYFDDDEIETNYYSINYDDEIDAKYYYINNDDKISKIKIIIDYQIKSFEYLFDDCACIESVNFIKFYRNNITNMNGMFSCCESLKELNLNNFNTNNVTDMSGMFWRCSSLKELNINNFNTNNVNDKSYMFSRCSNELIMKIKSQFVNLGDEAFKN